MATSDLRVYHLPLAVVVVAVCQLLRQLKGVGCMLKFPDKFAKYEGTQYTTSQSCNCVPRDMQGIFPIWGRLRIHMGACALCVPSCIRRGADKMPPTHSPRIVLEFVLHLQDEGSEDAGFGSIRRQQRPKYRRLHIWEAKMTYVNRKHLLLGINLVVAAPGQVSTSGFA